MASTSPMYFEQPIVIFDTTEALNLTTGSFVLHGGVSINATYDSTNLSTGAFVLAGGAAIDKNLNVGGIQRISNTTESSGTNSGALVVEGGVGIGGDLNVAGDATITGNLYINGTTTTVNTTTIDIEDNTILLNAGPAGSRDAGILIQRAGVDVTSEAPFTTGTLQSIDPTEIVLPLSDANVDGHYTGWWVKTSDGYAQITGYTASSKTASLTNITSSNTLGGSPSDLEFELFNRSYIANYFDEQADMYKIAYVPDATDIKTQLQSSEDYYADFQARGLYATNSTISNFYASSISAGSLTLTNAELPYLIVTTSATIANAFIGSVSAGSLYVTSESVLHGAVTAGALNVTGESLLQLGVTAGSLNVTGESLLHGAVTAGALNVTGESLLQLGVTAGSLNVTGESLLHGAVTTGALNVTGESLLQLGVTAGSLNVTGESLLQGAVTAGALNVTGESLLQLGMTGGSLNITGESTLNGSVTAGSLNVTGESLLQLGMTGGSLNVTGESTLHGAVTAGGLAVTGSSYFMSEVMITGANLTVTGGSIVFNTVDVSPSMADIIKERAATIGNAISAPENVLNFSFDNSVARAFDAVVSVTIGGTEGNKYAYYNLKGVQKASNWVLNSSFVGDITGITFSIDSFGQVQYTTTNQDDFVDGEVKFRALTTTV